MGTIIRRVTLQNALKKQIITGLKSAASGVMLALDNASADDFTVIDGELYKGDYNVSQNMQALDKFAKDNEVEVTLFYGDTRKATTITDKSGKRLIDTKAGAAVISAVLKNGQEYSSTSVIIADEPYYGYYLPVTDNSGAVIGMVFAGKPQKEAASFMQNATYFLIILALINFASCVNLAIIITNKHFIRPIRTLNTAADELAKGNTKYELQKFSNDEFGDLTDSFGTLMANINSEALVAEQMAAGDLTVSHEPVSAEDVMGKAISKMVHDNNQNLHQINAASDKMVTGVEEIAAASNSLAQGTTQQASAIEEITTSIGGIADSARINADGANRANTLVKQTREEAVQSNHHMNEMMAAMQDINDASTNISKIMKIIDDIASQTNIISLNASVEAARAGEHGKGFAVVAEEIRNLAAKSAEAANDSAKMIEDSIKKTEVGLNIATKTAGSLESILSSVEEMTTLIDEIATLSVNQSASVDQVNVGLSQISQVLQTNSATSEECAATSAQLSELADQLKEAVAKYRLKRF